MRILPRGKSSRFEVRCPRCDVSFPVETRTCVHCGGPTGEAGGLLSMEDPAEYANPEPESFGTQPGSIETQPAPFETQPASLEPNSSASESPFGVFGEAGVFGDRSRDEPTDGEGSQNEHGPPSFVQSLMRSMGSVIWIVLLIAFSLSRSCENG